MANLRQIADALIEAGMAPRSLFLVRDVSITVSSIAGGTFERNHKTIAFTQHVRSSLAPAQKDAASCTPIGSRVECRHAGYNVVVWRCFEDGWMMVVTPPSRNVLDSPHVHRAAHGFDDAVRGWIFVVKEKDQVCGRDRQW